MTELTNSLRAHWAALCLRRFIELTGCDLEDSLGDLLANLMHWAEQNNFDFDAALYRGRSHYEAELLEEGAAASSAEVADELCESLSEVLELIEGLSGINSVIDDEILGSPKLRRARAAIATATGKIS